MKKMYNKVLELFDKQGKKQVDLARYLGVSSAMVGNWVVRKKIPFEHSLAIAKFFGVTTDYLLDDKADLYTVKGVPVIGCASCGAELTDTSAPTGKQIMWRSDFWNSNLFAVIAFGDSMSPEIEDGDEVICDPEAEIHNGDLVYYRINGDDTAIKVFYKDSDAFIIQFIPYSTSEVFKTRTVRMDDMEYETLAVVKVVGINKMSFRNRAARLKLIGRG